MALLRGVIRFFGLWLLEGVEGERMMSEKQERPWTVYVLIAIFVVGSLVGLVLDNDRNLWDIVGLLFSAGIIYLLWLGKRWAFILMFVLIALCLLGVGLSSIMRTVAPATR